MASFDCGAKSIWMSSGRALAFPIFQCTHNFQQMHLCVCRWSENEWMRVQFETTVWHVSVESSLFCRFRINRRIREYKRFSEINYCFHISYNKFGSLLMIMQECVREYIVKIKWKIQMKLFSRIRAYLHCIVAYHKSAIPCNFCFVFGN